MGRYSQRFVWVGNRFSVSAVAVGAPVSVLQQQIRHNEKHADKCSDQGQSSFNGFVR